MVMIKMYAKVETKKEKLNIVGKPINRVDAIEKVTGTARYGADYYFPNMLYGKVLWSKYPHARILEIDTSEAEKLDGVAIVITHKDVPGTNKFGYIIPDQEVFASEKVISMYDAVAAVAAETRKIAEEAVKKIKVKYEPLPGIFDPRDALKENAPKIHPDGNLIQHLKTEKGDIKQGFSAADVVIEDEFKTQFIEHSFLEPEAALAVPIGDKIIIYASAHYPHAMAIDVSKILGIPLNKVRVIQVTVGGSFGGKEQTMALVMARAALLAMKTGRPVKLVNTREESMLGSKRHQVYMKYKVGATKDGKITALEGHLLLDGGAYRASSPWVHYRAHVHATGPYEIPNVLIDSYSVYTNNLFSSSMRGFGTPQTNFAVESLMDEIAEKLGIDPLELRLRNAFVNGSVTATGQVLDNHVVSIKQVLTRIAELANWYKKREEFREWNKKEPRYKKGIGLACSFRGVSFGGEGNDYAGSIVTINIDGTVTVSCGISEIGQGAKTVISQIAAEELGVPVENVTYLDQDTNITPYSIFTSASRGTFMGGMATKKAAQILRARISKVAAELLKSEPEKIVFENGEVYPIDAPERRITFKNLARECYNRAIEMRATGWHAITDITWDPETGKGDTYKTYTYSANIAEVTVDIETGKVRVDKMYAVHDAGRIINPKTARGQVIGGLSWAIGFALYEDFIIENGIPKTLNFDKYRLVRAIDMPEVVVDFVENPDPNGPFGAKGLAEAALEIGAPAIINAIYFATGVRIRQLPAKPEKILNALKHKKNE